MSENMKIDRDGIRKEISNAELLRSFEAMTVDELAEELEKRTKATESKLDSNVTDLTAGSTAISKIDGLSQGLSSANDAIVSEGRSLAVHVKDQLRPLNAEISTLNTLKESDPLSNAIDATPKKRRTLSDSSSGVSEIVTDLPSGALDATPKKSRAFTDGESHRNVQKDDEVIYANAPMSAEQQADLKVLSSGFSAINKTEAPQDTREAIAGPDAVTGSFDFFKKNASAERSAELRKIITDFKESRANLVALEVQHKKKPKSAEIARELQKAKEAYEKNRAEYVGGHAGRMLKERVQTETARVEKVVENRGWKEKLGKTVYDAYKWLGDKNLESYAAKKTDSKFWKTAGRVASLRTVVNLTLGGVALAASAGAAIGAGAIVTRRLMSGVGGSIASYDLMRQVADRGMLNATPESAKSMSPQDLATSMEAIEAKARVSGDPKLLIGNPAYDALRREFKTRFGDGVDPEKAADLRLTTDNKKERLAERMHLADKDIEAAIGKRIGKERQMKVAAAAIGVYVGSGYMADHIGKLLDVTGVKGAVGNAVDYWKDKLGFEHGAVAPLAESQVVKGRATPIEKSTPSTSELKPSTTADLSPSSSADLTPPQELGEVKIDVANGAPVEYGVKSVAENGAILTKTYTDYFSDHAIEKGYDPAKHGDVAKWAQKQAGKFIREHNLQNKGFIKGTEFSIDKDGNMSIFKGGLYDRAPKLSPDDISQQKAEFIAQAKADVQGLADIKGLKDITGGSDVGQQTKDIITESKFDLQGLKDIPGLKAITGEIGTEPLPSKAPGDSLLPAEGKLDPAGMTDGQRADLGIAEQTPVAEVASNHTPDVSYKGGSAHFKYDSSGAVEDVKLDGRDLYPPDSEMDKMFKKGWFEAIQNSDLGSVSQITAEDNFRESMSTIRSMAMAEKALVAAGKGATNEAQYLREQMVTDMKILESDYGKVVDDKYARDLISSTAEGRKVLRGIVPPPESSPIKIVSARPEFKAAAFEANAPATEVVSPVREVLPQNAPPAPPAETTTYEAPLQGPPPTPPVETPVTPVVDSASVAASSAKPVGFFKSIGNWFKDAGRAIKGIPSRAGSNIVNTMEQSQTRMDVSAGQQEKDYWDKFGGKGPGANPPKVPGK